MTKKKEKIKPETYQHRREQFLADLEAEAALLPPAPTSRRSRDIEYEYWPDMDLYYLTGVEESQVAALFLPDHPETNFVLFLRETDPETETWAGDMIGLEDAVETFGADEAHSISDLEERLPDYLAGRRSLCYPFGRYPSFDDRLRKVFTSLRKGGRNGKRAPTTLTHPSESLHPMRMEKTPQELNLHRRAIDLTWKGLMRAMKQCRPGLFEYELEATLDGEFRRRGCVGNAFRTIVAGGDNATVLHYTENEDRLNNNDLVLVDTGASYQYYSADITRTFPVNGTFTEDQATFYNVVLDCQKQIIDAIEPGVTFKELQDRTERLLAEGMIELGLLEGPLEEVLETDEEGEDPPFQKFFMHKFGHWLGLDVHDVGPYRRFGTEDPKWQELKQGMLVTVEPGLYVAPHHTDAPDQWRGMGVRIEDDVLVTSGGANVLSEDIPKDVDQIEELCSRD